MSLLPSWDQIDFEKMGEADLSQNHDAENQNPEDVTEPLDEAMEKLAQMPLCDLVKITAEEMFSDQLTSSPTLFLSQIIDETELLQSELTAKINWICEVQQMAPPDQLVLQVFGRDAYLSGKLKKDDGVFGKFIMGLNCGDPQTVVFNKQNYSLPNESCTPIFELDLNLEKSKVYPKIPKSTQIVYPNGRSSLKKKGYQSYLIWMFWENNPKSSKSKSKGDLDESQLTSLTEKLAEMDKNSEGTPSLLQSGNQSDDSTSQPARTFSV